MRLNFVLDGDLTVASLPGTTGFRDNWAQFGVSWTTNPITYFEPSQGGADISSAITGAILLAKVEDQFQGVSYTTRGGWDSAIFSGSHFTGAFHIDLTYSSSLGGYGWGLSLSSYAYARGGTAEADALETLKFQSATLTDGTPVEVTFDSGLQLGAMSPVPAPPSLALFGFGAIGLIAFRRLWQAE